ncbi:hypothetical protein DFH09DRAFT_1038497 [Mycena vulgaris]|nr:hypothetical protein DFH09DRAFT_1038497 [Mycena vulgaris]
MPPNPIDLDADILHSDDRALIARIRTLTSPEVVWPSQSTPRLPTRISISAHFGRIIAGWTPHAFTPQEREAVRLDGLRYLVIARAIAEVQRDIHPRALPAEVAAQLLFARQSYMLRYFRLFRINDLPTEVIGDILRLVVWDSMRRPVNARLHVTWTCRRWRQVALADATLWNAIWFRLWDAGTAFERQWAWFERARQAPLDIRIDGPKGQGEDSHLDSASVIDHSNKTVMRQTLLRLFAKLPAIRMLIIVVDDWDNALLVMELLQACSSVGVPLLMRFELHRNINNPSRVVADHTWADVASLPFLGGAVAPSLQYVSFNGVPIDWSASVLRNLTTLDIRRLPSTHSPDAARFREILINCPRLDKLSMDAGSPKFEEGDVVPIPLPYLRTLVVADFSRTHAEFLFRQFSAPNLNDLTLMNLCGADYLPLFVQLTSVFPKVRLLTAYSIQFDLSEAGMASMARFLDSMPLLEYLRVANVSPIFFAAFFRGAGAANPIAPHLVVADCQSLDPEIILHWAKDRKRLGTPLRKIYFSEEMSDRLEVEQVKALTSLCMLAKLPRGATTPEEEALSR